MKKILLGITALIIVFSIAGCSATSSKTDASSSSSSSSSSENTSTIDYTISKEPAEYYLKNALRDRIDLISGADASQSTYEIASSNSETIMIENWKTTIWHFYGNGYLYDKYGKLLSGGSSYTFEVKVSVKEIVNGEPKYSADVISFDY